MTTPVVPIQRSGTVVDARMSLAMWLRAGRSQRNMSLGDVSRITKIQVRILERLEAGALKPGDGMPAEVFVRGFVRSIAKCIGLDETEALRRYTEAAGQAALDPSPVTAGPAARAFVESMSELAPASGAAIVALAARTSSPRLLDSAPSFAAGSAVDLEPMPPVIEEIDPSTELGSETVVEGGGETVVELGNETVVETPPAEIAPAELGPAELTATDGKKKKTKKGTGKGRKRKAIATGTPFEPTPAVTQSIEIDPIATPTATAIDASEPTAIEAIANTTASFAAATESLETAGEPWLAEQPAEIVEPREIWAPKMPAAVAPTVPWRINASAQSLARSKASTGRVVPSLVIDDSDPDLAEREREDRAASRSPAVGRSFLPPILLDREDRSARQGGLTLAVIILLIAATLTLSYLMRRPSSSGDGVTRADLVESVDQLI